MLGWLRRLWGARAADPLADIDVAQTRLIVGLGNPGPKYAETRHNVGFRAVDELARRFGTHWANRDDDLRSEIAVTRQGDLTLILARPQTFMNRSGEAVAALLEHLGLPPRQTLVVYDEMDLPFGSLRLRPRGSAGTHNGMRSVVGELGTDDVARLRMGISQASPGSAIDHVLGEFEPDELPAVEQLVNRAADAALTWAIDGPSSAMNRYNKA
jgi:PTH1 family peptidyl-tRNA hydrolase